MFGGATINISAVKCLHDKRLSLSLSNAMNCQTERERGMKSEYPGELIILLII